MVNYNTPVYVSCNVQKGLNNYASVQKVPPVLSLRDKETSAIRIRGSAPLKYLFKECTVSYCNGAGVVK
jgi:hypothetical protein